MSARNPDPRLPTSSAHRVGRIRAAVTISIFSTVIGLLATPAFAQAAISLEPSQGEPGDPFTITGEGFGTGELVQLEWDGSPLGESFFADSDGAFSVTRTVPDAAQFREHTVTASDRPPNQLTAEATFTVAAPSSTTTTAEDDSTTTTAEDSTTTTASEDETTTTSASDDDDEETTATTSDNEDTTSDGVFGDSGLGVGVSDFQVMPGQASPGSEIVVEAELSGVIRRVTIWMGDTRLGAPAPVGADGSLQVTRTVPDLEPGSYWLKLETVNGKILDLIEFEVTAPDEAVAEEEIPTRFARSSLALGPLEWAVLLGILLLALLSVWFMWRKPKEDATGEKPSRWWQRSKNTPEDSDLDEADLFETPEPGRYNVEEVPVDDG